MAIEEAKSVARRPGMSPQLKEEREEYLMRSYIGLGQYDKVVGGDTPGECCRQSHSLSHSQIDIFDGMSWNHIGLSG